MIDKNLYIIGGTEDKDNKVSKSVEMYNIEKDTWTKLESMNSPRRGFGAICMPDGIYVFGGNDGSQTLKSAEK